MPELRDINSIACYKVRIVRNSRKYEKRSDLVAIVSLYLAILTL